MQLSAWMLRETAAWAVSSRPARRLPLEKFVSETIGLNDVEVAFHKMHKGEVLRSVVF